MTIITIITDIDMAIIIDNNIIIISYYIYLSGYYLVDRELLYAIAYEFFFCIFLHI